MSRVSRILQRGAQYAALERGLAQSEYKKPQFVASDRSQLPVAGEIVAVHGLPVTKTGRIIPGNPDAELERNLYIDTLAMEIDRQQAEVAERLKVMPRPEPFRPKEKVYKAKEVTPSMYTWRRPGLRRIFERAKAQRWAET